MSAVQIRCFLLGPGWSGPPGGIGAGEQTALMADAQSTVGKLMDRYRAADEMDSLAVRELVKG